MVLRVALVALLLPFTAYADYNSSGFDKAIALYKKRRYVEAAEIIQKSYDLKSKDLPLKVSHLAVLALTHAQQWKKADAVVDEVLRVNLPWWPPADATAGDVGEKLKRDAMGLRHLMYLAA
jgi:hypothetical protein